MSEPLILHKKTFGELTADELYELLTPLCSMAFPTSE